MDTTRRTLTGCLSALAVAGLTAAALTAGVPTSQADSRGTAGCTVTPVIPTDVAVGAQVSTTTGLSTVPVSFAVTGHCTSAQLRGIRWTGSAGDTPGIVAFGYAAGPAPESVSLDIDEAALVRVDPEPLPFGVHAGSTTFRVRHGAWLGYVPVPTPMNVFILRAQQWTESGGWGPLGGRVYVQRYTAGRWATLRSSVIDRHGQVSVFAPESGTLRFLVPGTTSREPAVLER